MNVALRTRPMTVDEFLAWEDRQELSFEFDGVQTFAMTGGTVAHAQIQVNLITALATRLAGTACRVFGSHLKIDAAGSIRYPDAFVVCSAQAPETKIVTNPVVIFQVLSESTGDTDRIVKNREYRDTPSVRRYVMLEQDRIGATVFARAGADWVGDVLAEGATLDMPEIDVALPLADLYAGIAFRARPDAFGPSAEAER